MTTATRPMTMADAETRLVTIYGYDRTAARELLRDIRDRARVNPARGTHDAATFSIDYSLTGARYGRGHFTFLEDEGLKRPHRARVRATREEWETMAR